MAEAPKPGSYARPWNEGDGPAVAPVQSEAQPTDEPDLWVIVGENRIPYRAGMTTAAHAFKVRTQTGIPRVKWLTSLVEDGYDIDSFAVLLWLARMQNGEPALDFADVLLAVTNAPHFDYVTGKGRPEAAEDPSPEA